MSKYSVYLDLDGCICDFFEQSRILFDIDNAPYEQWYFWRDWGITDDEFWKTLESDEDFWRKIPEYPWTESVVAAVKYYDPEFMIITSPHNCCNSYAGKCDWIKYNLNLNVPKRSIFTHEKHHCAAPNRILIDDSEDNIRKWTEAGGLGLLFPTPVNQSFEVWGGNEVSFVADHLRLIDKYNKL